MTEIALGSESVSGIYAIINTVNGKQYIGSAVNIARRWRQHRLALRRGCHHSRSLQRAWDKYSEAAFGFRMLEGVADVVQLIPREQHYLDTQPHDYNTCAIAGSTLGIPLRRESYEAYWASMRGKKKPNYEWTPEREEHLRRARERFAQLVRERADQGTKTCTVCGVTKPLSLFGRHGKYHYSQCRECARASANQRYRARRKRTTPVKRKPLSPETRAKIGTANRGRVHSPEVRANMRAAHVGRPWTPARRAALEARK